MTMNPLSVANAILDEALTQGVSVTPMQLQKLVYFLHGWHMEINNGRPLVSDNFEAWQFGPVLPAVYHEFKQFGSGIISGRAINPFNGEPWDASFQPQQTVLLREIIKIYGSLSGPRMSHLTHKDGTPWSLTWRNGVGSGSDIPNEVILNEFVSIRDRSAVAAAG